MKDCPECGAEVPVAAKRCKECFHDFSVKKKSSVAGPMLLLGTLALMAVIGAVTFFIVLQRPLETNVIVREDARTVDYITTYRTGPVTESVAFDRIASIEHVTSAGGSHEIAAVTLDGSRYVLMTSKGRPLISDAQHYEQVMEKPLRIVDNTRGFHKVREGAQE